MSGTHPKLIVEAGFDEYCMWAYTHNLPPGVSHDGLHENKKGTTTARYWHPSIVQNGKKLPTTIDDYGPEELKKQKAAHRKRVAEACAPLPPVGDD